MWEHVQEISKPRPTHTFSKCLPYFGTICTQSKNPIRDNLTHFMQESFCTHRSSHNLYIWIFLPQLLLFTPNCIYQAQQRNLIDDWMFVPLKQGWTGRCLDCSSIHPNSPPAPVLWCSRRPERVPERRDFGSRPVGICGNCSWPVCHSPPIRNGYTHLICDLSVHVNSSSCCKAVVGKRIVILSIILNQNSLATLVKA